MGFATPTNLDAYSRSAAMLFDENEIIGVPTGGQSFFGEPYGRTIFEPDSELFESDISRGTTTLAPTIFRGTDSSANDDVNGVSQEKWTNYARVYPLIEDSGTVTSSQIAKRIKGEASFGGLTKAQRRRKLAHAIHRETVKRSIRTMELLSWQVILTGLQSIIVGNVTTPLVFDFERNSNHAITPSVAWSASSTNIMGDLDTGWDLINTNGHTEADILLCGDTGIANIEENDAIQEISDNRRYFHNSIESPLTEAAMKKLTANGFGYRGRVTTTKGNKFHMFTYKKFHSGSTRYLPIDKVVMTSSQVVANRHFGPGDELDPTQQQVADYRDLMGVDINSMPSGVNIQGTQNFDPRWFTFGLDRTRKAFKFYSQVAPVFEPVMTDAWVVYDLS